jgi:hypothetical protein
MAQTLLKGGGAADATSKPLHIRLEQLWDKLKFSHLQRLEMMERYSAEPVARRLPLAVGMWELLTSTYEHRELLKRREIATTNELLRRASQRTPTHGGKWLHRGGERRGSTGVATGSGKGTGKGSTAAQLVVEAAEKMKAYKHIEEAQTPQPTVEKPSTVGLRRSSVSVETPTVKTTDMLQVPAPIEDAKRNDNNGRRRHSIASVTERSVHDSLHYWISPQDSPQTKKEPTDPSVLSSSQLQARLENIRTALHSTTSYLQHLLNQLFDVFQDYFIYNGTYVLDL